MQLRVTPQKFIVTALLVGCLLVVAGPLIVLAFYNHASPADDYCFADTSLRFGYWQAQRFYYDGWSGRFFHNFVVHASPLVWHWPGGYTVFPILLLLALLGGFYYLVSQVGYRLFSAGAALVMTAALAFLFMAGLVSIPEFFYWFPGLACYSLSCVFFLYLIGLFIRHDRERFALRPGLVALESLLIIGIIGSSETSMVMVMSFLAMVVLGQLLYRRALPVSLVLLLVVAAISCYFLITAPGNQVRMDAYPQSQDLGKAMRGALQFAVTYLAKQFFQTPLLPATLLFLPMAYRLTDPRHSLPAYLRLNPLLAFAHYAATVFALMFLHYWAVGIQPVPRLQNVINLVFLLGWFYNVTIWVGLARRRLEGSVLTKTDWLPVGLAGLGILLALVYNPNVRLLYGDIRSGRARQFDQAMNERYRILAAAPPDSVLLDPLPVMPATLVVEDIKDNPQHWWNRCWSGYYHKKTIRLRPAPTEVANAK